MKKLILLLLFLFSAFTMFSQNLVDKQMVLTDLKNRITIIGSEMETCKIRIKVNKNDFDAIASLSSKKEEIKLLKQNIKLVKKAIKTEKKAAKTLKKYQKLMTTLSSDNERVFFIQKQLQ